ncbi:hypothetical protein OJAV_G00179920 [Oryzias javanicus]|uniref:C-type lectin domain-containing protein n=1 Tax=Oryzias javanicus TaxID=123683 RepID=A0A437CC19_ORYJA|nr:hypothetical protein OJAV_G00179920 [Oryzias javanicus]
MLDPEGKRHLICVDHGSRLWKLLFFGTLFLRVNISHQIDSISFLRQYIFVPDKWRTWEEAAAYCNQMYDGLASISGPEDMKEISSSLPPTTRVWIGLYDALDSWKWSDPRTGENLGDYRPWQTGLPDNVGGVECCGAVSKDGYWRDYKCTGLLLPFLCFNAQQNGYVLEREPRSWLDAQSFCRLNHADLANLTNPAEGDEAKALLQRAGVEQAWFGLHRDSWVWTDGSDTSFTSWLTGQPNNAAGSQSCVYMEAEKWNDFPCSYQCYVLCQKLLPKRKKFVLKLQMSSDVNPDLPAVRGSLLQQLLSRLADSGLTDVRVSWR